MGAHSRSEGFVGVEEGTPILHPHVTDTDEARGPSYLMDGFTITGGYTSGANSPSGGGIYNDESSPTITNCSIIGNTAYDGYDGGGIYCETYSSPIITNCIRIYPQTNC